jgi:glycosyltransferase involved in cell wall biosynthesis
MKILVAHNRYQKPGGEDAVFQNETALLESYGHEVTRYTASNDDVGQYSLPVLAAKTIWNTASMRDVRAVLQRTRPDVIHVHNTFQLISPSIYSAAKAEGIPVVQTLHNFRLLCPAAILRRAGHVCEECVGTATRWPSVVHGCYRDSRATTAVVATMLTTHRMLGTWQQKIARYIAQSQFAKQKFVQDGWPADKIVVKPNFLPSDPGGSEARQGFALFVGRLSEEKGVGTLLKAVRGMPGHFSLKIAGQGPLQPADTTADSGVVWLGHQSRLQILHLMKTARVLVMPSEWYESCPMTIIEALASGLPVITTRIGTMPEMVTDGVTGLLVPPADADALGRAITWALGHPAEMEAMGKRARDEFELKYTPDQNYRALMAIYRSVLN